MCDRAYIACMYVPYTVTYVIVCDKDIGYYEKVRLGKWTCAKKRDRWILVRWICNGLVVLNNIISNLYIEFGSQKKRLLLQLVKPPQTNPLSPSSLDKFYYDWNTMRFQRKFSTFESHFNFLKSHLSYILVLLLPYFPTICGSCE